MERMSPKMKPFVYRSSPRSEMKSGIFVNGKLQVSHTARYQAFLENM